MVKRFYEILKARRRRRALVNIRRAFESAGYPLDQFGDSQIEAALTRWTDDITTVTLNAKAMYRTLGRLRGVPAGNRKAGLRRDVFLPGNKKKEMKILIAYDGSESADKAIDDLSRAGLPVEVDALVLGLRRYGSRRFG